MGHRYPAIEGSLSRGIVDGVVPAVEAEIGVGHELFGFVQVERMGGCILLSGVEHFACINLAQC